MLRKVVFDLAVDLELRMLSTGYIQTPDPDSLVTRCSFKAMRKPPVDVGCHVSQNIREQQLGGIVGCRSDIECAA